jgi:hypothetical protein
MTAVVVIMIFVIIIITRRPHGILHGDDRHAEEAPEPITHDLAQGESS